MSSAGKRERRESDEQRNLTTFFSLRDVGYLVMTGIIVASAFFTFGTRISVLEHAQETTVATIIEMQKDDNRILELGADINYKLADVISKENRLILDVQKIEKRLHDIEVKGGVKGGVNR